MMKAIIAGNWKMNKDNGQSRELVLKLMSLVGIDELKNRQVILIPPFTSLSILAELVMNSPIKLGAQNMHWERSGAFTGEVSGVFIKQLGCEYVIIGHSERRHLMGETNKEINRKLKTALDIGLIAILCVGETGAERDAGQTESVIEKQLTQGLEGFENEAHKMIIAYEPVWAIGTGKTATLEQAVEVHKFIRGLLKKPSTIIYGGSVKSDNIDQLMAHEEIQGVLVGGASLDPESFARIIQYQKFLDKPKISDSSD
ncbi:triose-phosphate isomerase [candidate division WOR-3 bacterium RBG_13_43_14]|uniref:Triosephosphate isomerase n=1 Tax=candidate division WOR-3 bacterium RBG_13_43_14 TaxID=1802590 RepID=A0A1F4UFF9_UNCW3|nr:MAG: triose-phosphate isomerase [candidate division WOR-3 bacterium RBG_13_43_14]